MYLKDHRSSTYVIIDEDLDMTLEIDLSILEDTEFDLIKWYISYAKTNGMFYEKYIEHHCFGYQPVIGYNTSPITELSQKVVATTLKP